MLFPRALAPRLYEVRIGMCRRAGFEPKLRRGSFHTGWDLGSLADLRVVALAPRSVASNLTDGIVALPLTETDRLDTRLVWRKDGPPPAVEAFRSAARAAFGTTE